MIYQDVCYWWPGLNCSLLNGCLAFAILWMCWDSANLLWRCTEYYKHETLKESVSLNEWGRETDRMLILTLASVIYVVNDINMLMALKMKSHRLLFVALLGFPIRIPVPIVDFWMVKTYMRGDEDSLLMFIEVCYIVLSTYYGLVAYSLFLEAVDPRDIRLSDSFDRHAAPSGYALEELQALDAGWAAVLSRPGGERHLLEHEQHPPEKTAQRGEQRKLRQGPQKQQEEVQVRGRTPPPSSIRYSDKLKDRDSDVHVYRATTSAVLRPGEALRYPTSSSDSSVGLEDLDNAWRAVLLQRNRAAVPRRTQAAHVLASCHRQRKPRPHPRSPAARNLASSSSTSEGGSAEAGGSRMPAGRLEPMGWTGEAAWRSAFTHSPVHRRTLPENRRTAHASQRRRDQATEPVTLNLRFQAPVTTNANRDACIFAPAFVRHEEDGLRVALTHALCDNRTIVQEYSGNQPTAFIQEPHVHHNITPAHAAHDDHSTTLARISRIHKNATSVQVSLDDHSSVYGHCDNGRTEHEHTDDEEQHTGSMQSHPDTVSAALERIHRHEQTIGSVNAPRDYQNTVSAGTFGDLWITPEHGQSDHGIGHVLARPGTQTTAPVGTHYGQRIMSPETSHDDLSTSPALCNNPGIAIEHADPDQLTVPVLAHTDTGCPAPEETHHQE